MALEKVLTQNAGSVVEKAIDVNSAVQTIAPAANITIDWSVYRTAKVTMNRDIAFAFTGAPGGARVMLIILQDGTGGRTPSFGAEVRCGTDFPTVTVDENPNKQSYLGFIKDPDLNKYDFISPAKGF
jgi:hypothetical protein